VQRARLVLGERLGRIQVQRARAAVAQSTSSVGSWKHSDLPEAVPVVTIVGALERAMSAAPAPGGRTERDGGGRVNRLTARPALALFYPELAQRAPAARRRGGRAARAAGALPFATGYGVEIAMLIDAWRKLGLDGIAQVDLDEHRNRHQPLSALEPMALTVLATIARRLEQRRAAARRRGLPAGGEFARSSARRSLARPAVSADVSWSA
jgi:hypothetical protein